jgi:CRP-like cAMP-binding protein
MMTSVIYQNNQIAVSEIKKLKTFSSLDDKQLSQLAQYMVRRTYTPGQFIFLEGDDSTGIWFILDGKVRIIKQSLTGRTQGLCLVDSGKCFGSCPLFDSESTNPADAQALTEVTLAIIPRGQFQDLVYTDIAVAMTLLKICHSRMGLLAKLGEYLGTWSVGMRIEDCLIAHAESVSDRMLVKLTHDNIAALVGTVREVVSRHLSELENLNIIKCHPGIIDVLQIKALRNPCIREHASANADKMRV